MWVIRNKKTKTLPKFGDGRGIMVYLKRDKASIALQAFRQAGRQEEAYNGEYEIVPVKLKLDKELYKKENENGI